VFGVVQEDFSLVARIEVAEPDFIGGRAVGVDASAGEDVLGGLLDGVDVVHSALCVIGDTDFFRIVKSNRLVIFLFLFS